ncbi:hypothetical protein MRX96_015138 [Rhipicephalus microplus]
MGASAHIKPSGVVQRERSSVHARVAVDRSGATTMGAPFACARSPPADDRGTQKRSPPSIAAVSASARARRNTETKMGGRCAGVKGSPLVIQYAAGYDGSSVGAVTEGRRSLRRHPLPSFFAHRQGRSGAASAPITRALLAGEPPSQLCGVPPTVWRGPRCDRDAAACDRLGAQTAAATPRLREPLHSKEHVFRRPPIEHRARLFGSSRGPPSRASCEPRAQRPL